jgi:hypothetical protein
MEICYIIALRYKRLQRLCPVFPEPQFRTSAIFPYTQIDLLFCCFAVSQTLHTTATGAANFSDTIFVKCEFV